MWGENDIPIGSSTYVPMLYTRVYEVEYLHGHKSSLVSNIISENLFPQFDEEGNRFMVFYEIIDHSVDGTDPTKKDAFIVSNNEGNRKRGTTKV